MSESERRAKFLALLPPRIDFAPPEGFRENYTSKQIVYGVPLSKEWLDSRYELDAPFNPDPDSETGLITREYFLELILFDITDACNRLMPEFSCYPTAVKTANHGFRPFVVIGRPWARPTREEIHAIRVQMLKFLVVDRPGWFPTATL